MREPPPGLDEPDVLAAVRDLWQPEVDSVEHLPVGFGAHHWMASVRGRPVLFVTLDALGSRHDAASLETAYAVASGLMFPLDFVVAPVPSTSGRLTASFHQGALSVTPWVAGSSPERVDLDVTARLLERLHAVPPASGAGRWRPLTPSTLGDDLATLAGRPWDGGPYGERARSALRGRLDAVAEWSATYHALAEVAGKRTWVLTHGEPHERNQLVTPDGTTLLVDWETVLVAPAERDWRTLVERGLERPLDPAMLDLFDLEWRLDEISQYAAWFSSPHAGDANDRVAIGGLLHELTRAPLQPSR